MFDDRNPTTWSDADWAAAFAFANDAPRVDDGDALQYLIEQAA